MLPVRAELIRADGETDGQTDMTKISGHSGGCVDAPNRQWQYYITGILLLDVTSYSLIHAYQRFRKKKSVFHFLHPNIYSKFKYRAHKKIFEPKVGNLMGRKQKYWSNSYSWRSAFQVIKSRRMWKAEYVECGSDIYIYISSSSSVICQTTGPKPLPKRFFHIVRSRAYSFNWQYSLLSLRSSSSFLRLLPRLLVTSICPFIFP